jgi:diaminopimelate decarboxylase
MRAELPSAIAAAIGRCTRASLVFDLGAIAETMQRVATAARAAEIVPLFAAKAFPHPAVRALAAHHLAGFDVASPGELREVPAGAIVSIADPSGAAIDAARGRAGRVIVACDTVEQMRAAPRGAEIAIRVSASLTGRDPAIGAVLEGSGHRRSRFGLETGAAIGELARAATGRRLGLHVHHGPVVATTAERFVATARAALALADFEPAFLDLGGAWHGIGDLATALAAVRAALPRSLELLIEPGRLYSEGAGFACGRVTATRALSDRELRVVDLSRICHLRWSAVELVAPPPRTGEGRSVLFVGPTCFEEDVLGEWTIDDRVADRIMLRGVTGYAVAWNTGFGGIAPADVVLV